MPSATPSRSTFTFPSWRGPKQNRYRSTGQEFKTVQDDERMSAMLHGEKRNEGRKETFRRPPPEHAASNPSSQQSATSSRHNAQTSNQFNQPSDRSHKQTQRGQPGVLNRKRKATASLDRRPARRQRGSAPELKDEAYIRSTMHMPTPKEYPDAPPDIFKNPKGSIYNLAHGHGLAECRSEFTALAEDAHQCTAYYTSATHNQVVIGEGRTKASRSDS